MAVGSDEHGLLSAPSGYHHRIDRLQGERVQPFSQGTAQGERKCGHLVHVGNQPTGESLVYLAGPIRRLAQLGHDCGDGVGIDHALIVSPRRARNVAGVGEE